jgi:hypothetical protein
VTTEKGDRLATLSLTTPITVAVARALVREVIAAAEAINSDRRHHYMVERIVLIGSLLGGAADEKVGEVDVGYRTIPRPNRLKLVDRSLYAEFDMFVYSGDVPKRLKVHRKVTLHELTRSRVRRGRIVFKLDQPTGRGVTTLPW